MPFPDEFLRELKERNDIVSVVSSYVNIRQRGRTYSGLCPFHSERSPSFTVYPDTESFYCFGCQTGGDVITFIKKIENLDYLDAVKLLAGRSGLQVPESRYTQEDGMRQLKNKIYEINREAARWFYNTLYSEKGREGLEYLRGKRGLDDSIIRRFGLGFAPDGRRDLTDFLLDEGYKPSDLIAANVTVNKSGLHDRFYNRVMFPIIDVMGNVVAFGGRTMGDDKPKYLNTSDTPAYKKTNNLYSLNLAKNSKAGKLIVCEGYMDVIALYSAGFDNVVGGLGTALTEQQVKLLRRYGKESVLCYDSDEAGQKAAVKAMQLCDKFGVNTHVIKVPDGKDPDEYIKRHGENGYIKFKALVDGALNDADYFFSMLRDKYDTDTVDGKLAILEESAVFLAGITNPVKRDLYTGRICDETGIKRSSLEPMIDTHLRRIEKQNENEEKRRVREEFIPSPDRAEPSEFKAKSRRSGKAEEMLCALMIVSPDMVGTVKASLEPERFTMPLTRRLYTEILRLVAAGEPVTATMLSSGLNDEESARLAGMIAKYYDSAGATPASALCREYIDIVISEGEKKSVSELALQSDEEIDKYLKALNAKKRKKK